MQRLTPLALAVCLATTMRQAGHSHTRLIHVLLVTMVGLLTVFGLFANHYSARGRQRFTPSKPYLVYAILVTCTFTSIYTHDMYQDYAKSRQLNLRDAIKVYSYMNITVAIINFVTQMFMSKQVAQLMNQVPLFKTLRQIHIDGGTIKRSVAIALVKGIGFPLVLGAALMLQQQRYHPQLNWMWSVYKLIPMVISNLLNNCYFGAMIIVKAILEALNTQLKLRLQQLNLIQQADQLKLHTNYYRMQKFCLVADELDFIAAKYKLVCIQAMKYMDLMALSMVLSLLCHVLGITIGFFNQYQAVTDSIIDKKPYDAFGAFINLLFLIISFSEITLLGRLSSDILEATRQTGIVLQTARMQLADCRFRQAVDKFSLQILCIKFKIMPLGLFEINVSIIIDVLSTVASFLLILIQTDLYQRFKIK